MTSVPKKEITEILLAWSEGENEALIQLLPLAYGKLRQIAAGQLRREGRGPAWQTSELVHEAYLRLMRQSRVRWRSRTHFFAIAAQMMRRVLVDHARSTDYAKRGGGVARVPLEEAEGLMSEPAAEFLPLYEALQALSERSAEQAHIVELRYFGGLTKAEIASALDISESTVSRRWRMARAWLHRFLAHRETDGLGGIQALGD